MAKGLTRELLIRTALEIVDREGLEKLSMRKLGAALGVDPMAAYRHLPNKDALLDGVVEAVMAEVDTDTDPNAPWDEQLRQLGRGNLRALLAHPNAAPLLAQRALVTPASLRLPEKAFQIMTRAGIPLREAGLAINTLGLLATSIAVASAAAAVDTTMPERIAAYQALPRGEFPTFLQALETGQLASGFDEVLEYSMNAIVLQLEACRRA